jgi:hypothetical protein
LAVLRTESALFANKLGAHITGVILAKIEGILAALHFFTTLQLAPSAAVGEQGLPSAVFLPSLEYTWSDQPELRKSGCNFRARCRDLFQDIEQCLHHFEGVEYSKWRRSN